MFRNTRYDTWDSESKTLQQAHGAVVSQKGNVYTYSDGYVYTADHGSSLSLTIGDFFYGIGFIKNKYIGRTFIQGSQKQRERLES